MPVVSGEQPAYIHSASLAQVARTASVNRSHASIAGIIEPCTIRRQYLLTCRARRESRRSNTAASARSIARTSRWSGEVTLRTIPWNLFADGYRRYCCHVGGSRYRAPLDRHRRRDPPLPRKKEEKTAEVLHRGGTELRLAHWHGELAAAAATAGGRHPRSRSESKTFRGPSSSSSTSAAPSGVRCHRSTN